MAIEFTDQQKDAIKAKGTVLVSAAAGSGKTAVLTERVIRRICDPRDSASIDRLLIVTFTNASALEMRSRIAKALEEVSAQNPNNLEILKQKMLLGSAKICTIDSFCIDLVRKNFGVLGISPDFSVASSAQTAALREQALKKVLASFFSSPDEDFNQLCELFEIYKGERNLYDAVFSVYDFSLCLSRPSKWLDSAVDNYFVDNINNSVFSEVIYDRAQSKLLNCKERINLILRETQGTDFEANCIESFGGCLDYFSNMQSAIDKKQWDILYNLAANFIKPELKRRKRGQSEIVQEKIKNVRNKVHSTITSIAEDMCGDSETALLGLNITGRAQRSLIKIVTAFKDEYFTLLLKKNMLTFPIIEQLALQLLCVETEEGLMPSELSKDLSELYDEVLVDEYQDNNDLQDALFNAVSDNGKKLFMVGDVKQCIYSFRNANPDNFLRHKEAYPNYTNEEQLQSKVILSSNFRSRKGICDFVNGICSTLMQKSTCGFDYNKEEALDFGANYPENNLTAAEIMLNDISDNTVNRDIADANSIADYILGALSENAFLRDDNGLRKADYKDFAILLRSPKNRVRFYVDALKSRGIPVIYNSGDFYDSFEILTAISILKAIDNPTRDIPLLSAMTSVVFGFSYDEVATIKSNFIGGNLYARVVNSANNGNEKCLKFIETLALFRKMAVTMPISRLIYKIYNETKLVEILSSGENGSVKKSNLLYLCSMAADFEKLSDGGLSAFIDHFDRSASEGTSTDKAPAANVNAVRIMTFHGSKGLQFPICIVAGCGNGFNLLDLKKQLIINGKYGIGMNYVVENSKTSTIARNALRMVQLTKLIAEELRLFYVAQTRAEERLVLSVTAKDMAEEIRTAAASLGLNSVDTGKVPTETVLSAIGLKQMILCAALLQKSGDKLCSLANINPVKYGGIGDFKLIVNKITSEADECKNDIINDTEVLLNETILNEIEQRFSYQYPFSDECSIPSKIAVTELVHKNNKEYDFSSRPRFLSKSGLTPAERGTAVHKFFQYADFSKASVDLDGEISRLFEWEFLSQEESDSIDRVTLGKFFKSELYSRLINADRIMREYKFMVKYPYLEHETIIQGIADCIFFEQGEIVIVDFKTDNVSNLEILKERYAQQLEIYKTALEEIFDAKVKECIIYSVKLCQEICC